MRTVLILNTDFQVKFSCLLLKFWQKIITSHKKYFSLEACVSYVPTDIFTEIKIFASYRKIKRILLEFEMSQVKVFDPLVHSLR